MNRFFTLCAAVVSSSVSMSIGAMPIAVDLAPVLGGNSSSVRAINESGAVAGYSWTQTSAGCDGCWSSSNFLGFVYDKGVATTIPTLGGSTSIAYDINNRGEVAGHANTAPSPVTTRAIISDGTTSTNLGILVDGTPTYSPMSAAYALNDSGDVVGYSGTVSDAVHPYHAFLYSQGSMADLGTLGGTDSNALDINNSRQIVGWSDTANGTTEAMIYDNGVMTGLGTLGGSDSYAQAINNAGLIVGGAQNAAGYERAFIFDDQMRDIGTLGGLFSASMGINDRGDVVGYSATASGAVHAFLFDGSELFDLNNLFASVLSGITLQTAWDINNQGQIAADGIDANGYVHAFLLSLNGNGDTDCKGPGACASVPEPGSLSLIVAGCLFLVMSRWSRSCGTD